MEVDKLIGRNVYKYVNWHGQITEALFNKPVKLPNNKIYYNFFLRKGFVNLTQTQVNQLIFEKSTDDTIIKEQISQKKGSL